LNIIRDHPNRRLARSKEAALMLLLIAHTQRMANVTDDAAKPLAKKLGKKIVQRARRSARASTFLPTGSSALAASIRKSIKLISSQQELPDCYLSRVLDRL
jgi:hypothetical protein